MEHWYEEHVGHFLRVPGGVTLLIDAERDEQGKETGAVKVHMCSPRTLMRFESRDELVFVPKEDR